ncbi:hypothetical protein [Streptomyces sp. NPDC031705]|uniref:hypothetical protein n=1 Tax=Streptomyces sp. NPDC031705 TaxID=3155729 RepID=UPI0033CDA537
MAHGEVCPAAQLELVPRRTVRGWLRDMLRDLFGWVARRPLRLPEGHEAVPHSADVRMAVWAVTVVDLISGVVVDAMVPPAYRLLHLVWVVAVLVLSLGSCAMTVRAPHVIDGTVLRLRTGPLRELVVPLHAVAAVRSAHGAHTGHGLRRVLDDAEAVACSVSSATTLVLDLVHPLPVPFRRGGAVPARRVYFAADQPSAAARLITRAAAAAKP